MNDDGSGLRQEVAETALYIRQKLIGPISGRKPVTLRNTKNVETLRKKKLGI